jgi:enoyl-CoA hydratase
MVDEQEIGGSNGIRLLRLSHGRVSALDVELCQALTTRIRALAADQCRAVVLTGTGSAFCAGVDLKRVLDGGTPYLEQFLPAMAECFEALLTFPKPLIGAINGHAIAGGCIIAATCDWVVMAEGKGRMGLTELAVGVPFPVLPIEIIRARVPEPGFRELVLGADTVLPERALELGLVHELTAPGDLLTRASAHAERMAAMPSHAFRLTKASMVAPILTQTRNGATVDADVAQMWGRPEVLEPIRTYMNALKR